MDEVGLKRMADRVANLQRLLGEPGVVIFTKEEALGLIEVYRHRAALVSFAKEQEARSIIWQHWRGMIIGTAALITAIMLLWDKVGQPILNTILGR